MQINLRQWTILLLTLMIPCGYTYCQNSVNTSRESLTIEYLRDSLDKIQYLIPQIPKTRYSKTITVRNKAQWDTLSSAIESSLKMGDKNVEIRLKRKWTEPLVKTFFLSDLCYPDVNIRIIGDLGLKKQGIWFEQKNAMNDGEFWTIPYTDYEINDIFEDELGNEVLLREDVSQLKGDIINVKDGVWKFEIDLPDLTEAECKDFYVLITRDWTSARHRVLKVKEGWLYYYLDSSDLHSERNPNADWNRYNVRPRLRLINSPVSKGIHVSKGILYVPHQYKKIRVNKGGALLQVKNCHLNSLEITGFELNGWGNNTPITITNSVFHKGAFIHNNSFVNIASICIRSIKSENVIITNNYISNTWQQAIEGGTKNCTIANNYLKNIGWFLNTRAITGSGENLHICDNVIEDFNYSAIAVGSRTPNDIAGILTYIIERNSIRLTNEYSNSYINNTLADSGGIYIGPQCTRGIIRHNIVDNICGISINRGIYLDDGAKNLAIYGNLITNTANCYDIDLRFCSTYSKDIPDHNHNNTVFQNIMTGGYRFEDAGDNTNCFVGQNVLLGKGKFLNTIVDVHNSMTDYSFKGKESENNKKILIHKSEAKKLKELDLDKLVMRQIIIR